MAPRLLSPPDPSVPGAGRLAVNSRRGRVRRFWPLALMVAMGLLFTKNPEMIRYVEAGLVVFVVSAFAMIFGAYAFVHSRAATGEKGRLHALRREFRWL